MIYDKVRRTVVAGSDSGWPAAPLRENKKKKGENLLRDNLAKFVYNYVIVTENKLTEKYGSVLKVVFSVYGSFLDQGMDSCV